MPASNNPKNLQRITLTIDYVELKDALGGKTCSAEIGLIFMHYLGYSRITLLVTILFDLGN